MEPRRDDGDDEVVLSFLGDLTAAAMEPRRDDGDDAGESAGPAAGSPAAMEPRRDDGDDEDAAMEPRRDDGDDSRPVRSHRNAGWVPQWSPVVTTGTTLGLGGGLDLVERAAMEPRRDDGDDAVWPGRHPCRAAAAMEPRRDDGDDLSRNTPTGQTSWPQWSPVVTTGTTRDAGLRTVRYRDGRNGAPS